MGQRRCFFQPEYGRQYDYVPEELEDTAPEQPEQHYQEEGNYEFVNDKAPAQQSIGLNPEQAEQHPLGPRAHPMADTGLTAVAVYDYQKQDDDEISFEPDDVITNIEQVEEKCSRFRSLID